MRNSIEREDIESLVEDLLNSIVQLSDNNEISKREKQTLSSKIKREYNMLLQTLKHYNQRINVQDLKKIIYPLIKNYDNLKDLSQINEVLQTTSNEYNNEGQELTEKEELDALILGNPGTKIDGMSSEYISKIIKRKLTGENGINRDDIMNLLNMQHKNMYLDIEEYQNLINDSVMSYLTTNQSGKKISNPQMLDIMGGLATSYKIQGNLEKVKEIYEQALKIKSLEDTDEYREIQDSYNEFMSYLEMKNQFEPIRFNSFDDLVKAMKVKYTNDKIFTKGTKNQQTTNFSGGPSESNYIMPRELKVKGFERLANALRLEDKGYEMVECEFGKDVYDGYIIVKIENANVSILENFNDVNARIFIVKNEVIDQVKKLTRNDALYVDGVEGVNHIQNFDNYCKHLIEKTKRMIRETQIGEQQPEEEEIFFSDDMFEEEIESETLPNITIEDVGIEDNEITIEQEENENIVSSDKVENERRKAHEKRKKLQHLREEMDRIKKEATEKIEAIKKQMDEIEENDKH